MSAGTIVIPLPNHDFDPTEVAVPWRILHSSGYRVRFATPDGQRGYADPIMISGEGLDPWGFIPGLKKIKLFGLFLRANRDGREAYRLLEQDKEFLEPLRYADLRCDEFDALLLPGGHAKRMLPYYESEELRRFVVDFFRITDGRTEHKPVAAICHGMLVASRSIGDDGRSLLYGRKTTCLPWKFERDAWHLCKYLIRFWDPNYYRTYMELPGEPEGYRGVEEEVKRSLASPDDYLGAECAETGRWKKGSALFRDTLDDSTSAWVVVDGNYVSARWPGDAHTFALEFLKVLAQDRE